MHINEVIENRLNRVDVEGTEHFEGVWSVEDGWQFYTVFHVGADNKIIDVAGVDDTPYKAWVDVYDYCDNNGLNYFELEDATKDYKERWEKAWRIKYPAEAAEYDKFIMEKEAAGVGEW